MKILLPDTIELDPALPEGWESATVDARAEIPAEHHDAEVLVLWGPSRAHLVSAVENLDRLQLVQSLSAGVEGIVAAGFPEQVPIATGAGLHSRTVSEHTTALAVTLLARPAEGGPAPARQQLASEAGGLPPLPPEGWLAPLNGGRCANRGFGQIGQ